MGISFPQRGKRLVNGRFFPLDISLTYTRYTIELVESGVKMGFVALCTVRWEPSPRPSEVGVRHKQALR